MTMQQLEDLRTRLVRAQRAENTCVRKLNAMLMTSPSDRTAYDKLAEECHAARQRSTAAYKAWSDAVGRYRGQMEGIPTLETDPMQSLSPP
jgi:GrpB-like predicted nucleotidyltransferase (UPF0157 family)